MLNLERCSLKDFNLFEMTGEILIIRRKTRRSVVNKSEDPENKLSSSHSMRLIGRIHPA